MLLKTNTRELVLFFFLPKKKKQKNSWLDNLLWGLVACTQGITAVNYKATFEVRLKGCEKA
jgi:hypothetical protein